MEEVAPRSRAPKIRVVVRKRPLTTKEATRHEEDILVRRSDVEIVVVEEKQKVDLTKYIEEHRFVFDNVYDESVSNFSLYEEAVQPLVEAAFERAKVTCFAYGQTGSGKTFTMMGNVEDYEHAPGMYLLAAQDLFQILDNHKYDGFSVWVSFYEIYCGKLFDLFNERGLVHARQNHKGRVVIANLQEIQVANWQHLMQQIAVGLNVRTTGVTGMNMDSSRSHAVLQIVIKDPKLKAYGKLSFIDLAGSERGADTIEQNKQTRLDGAEINKSLLALKECIRALDQDKRHTPFRGSKLTQVLKDSFIGNCRTTMIANVSPSKSCCEHTLNTLRYADRVKELKRETAHAMTSEETLARELMLPRQPGNSRKIMVATNSDDSGIETPPPHSTFVPATKTAHNFHSQKTGHVNPHMQQRHTIKRTQTSLKAPTSFGLNHSEHSQRPGHRSTIVKPTNLTPKSKNLKITLTERLQIASEPGLFKANSAQPNIESTVKPVVSESLLNQSGLAKPKTLRAPTKVKQYVLEEEEAEAAGGDTSSSKIPKLRPSFSKKKVESFRPTRAISPHLPSQKASPPQVPSLTSLSINFTQQKPSPGKNSPQMTKDIGLGLGIGKIAGGRKGSITQGRPQTGGRFVAAVKAVKQEEVVEQKLKEQQHSLNLIKDEHSRLVHNIIKQEELFTQHHRSHIDRMVDFIKKEMKLADQIEMPDSDLKGYVDTLDQLLKAETESIGKLHGMLERLRGFISKEEEMETNFIERQEEIEVFDLNQPEIDFPELYSSKQGQGGHELDSDDLNARQGEQGDVFPAFQTPPRFD